VYNPLTDCASLYDSVKSASILADNQVYLFMAKNSSFVTYNFLIDFVTMFGTGIQVQQDCNLDLFGYDLGQNAISKEFWAGYYNLIYNNMTLLLKYALLFIYGVYNLDREIMAEAVGVYISTLFNSHIVEAY
jgi:hypothetical protein